jgi:hypothetical protein
MFERINSSGGAPEQGRGPERGGATLMKQPYR